jgi:hypothetical protein
VTYPHAKPGSLRAPWPLTLTTLSVATLLAACGGGGGGGEITLPPQASAAPQLQVLSSRADMVTGGDALIDVALPDGATGSSAKVLLNGTDITGSLKYDAATNRMQGVVTGLKIGANQLVAESTGGARRELTLTNHPVTGPVFSGPQESPFICQTAQFRVYAGGPLLGAATDANCSVATRVDYVYRATDNTYKAFDPQAGTLPADLRQATTKDGATVPYIVPVSSRTM